MYLHNYSRRRLMGSRLMGSFVNGINLNMIYQSLITFLSLMYWMNLVHLLIGFNRLMLSVWSHLAVLIILNKLFTLRPFYHKHKLPKCPYKSQTIYNRAFITEQDFTESLDSKLVTIQQFNYKLC
jgi:hypothetical protein